MNLKTFFNLVKFAVSQAPATALAILKDLRPDQWEMYDGEAFVTSYKPSFKVEEIFKQKRLVVEIEYTRDGQKHTLVATTRFKNDGTDTLTIDGRQMGLIENQIFDFDAMPGRREVRIEMRFLDGGLPRDISLVNQF